MVRVDPDKCIGCGLCVASCPETFKLEDGKSQVIDPEAKKCPNIKEVVESCPASAIKIENK